MATDFDLKYKNYTDKMAKAIKKDIEDKIGNGEAKDIQYDNTGSGLAGDNVQDAIDNLAGDSHTHNNKSVLDATEVAFTNTKNTKLNGIEDNATRDQDAIDVPYSNVNSGISATDVQGAIDSIDSTLDTVSGDSHTHSNKAILDAIEEAYTTSEKNKLAGIEDGATADLTADEIKSLYESNNDTNAFTDAEKEKLANLTDKFKGYYADAAARDAAVPNPAAGDYVLQEDTNSLWFYDDTGNWVDTGSTSTGDMLASVYDPRGVAGDTFLMDNMTEGTDTKIMTQAERDKLADTETTSQLNDRDTANRNTDNHTTGTINSVYTIVERDKLAGIEDNAKDDQIASEVPYDNSTSGLTATEVQSAIDELDTAFSVIKEVGGLVWDNQVAYKIGTVIGYDNEVYIALVDNTDEQPDTSTSWKLLHTDLEKGGLNYDNSYDYLAGTIVHYAGIPYVSAVDISAGAGVPSSNSDWVILRIPEYGGLVWDSGKSYEIGTLATKGKFIYKALKATTNDDPATNPSIWQLMSEGGNLWDSDRDYPKGSVVSEGDYLFIAKADIANGGINPSASSDWLKYVSPDERGGVAWSDTTDYLVNDLVVKTNVVYIALQENTDKDPETEIAYWKKLEAGESVVGKSWNSTPSYVVGDIVSHQEDIYIAKQDNTNVEPSTDDTVWGLP